MRVEFRRLFYSGMTQEEFQKAVLNHFQKLEDRLVKIERFADRQEEVNRRQEEVNQTLLESQDGLVKLIEHEIVERFEGMSDGTKAYTDVKIREHETNYHPRSAVAQSNL